MTSTMRKSIGVIASVILVAAAVFAFGLFAARADGAKAGDMTHGARLWAENCNRCHNMRDPKEFDDTKWKVIVTHMRVRAGLTGQDARDILAFLQASN